MYIPPCELPLRIRWQTVVVSNSSCCYINVSILYNFNQLMFSLCFEVYVSKYFMKSTFQVDIHTLFPIISFVMRCADLLRYPLLLGIEWCTLRSIVMFTLYCILCMLWSIWLIFALTKLHGCSSNYIDVYWVYVVG